MFSMDIAASKDWGETTPISLVEVAMVVKKLFSSGTLGVVKTCSEMLKLWSFLGVKLDRSTCV